MSRFSSSKIRINLIWVIILFITLPFLAFPEIILGNQTLFWSDLSWIHYPRHIFAAREWLAGRVPLWDPYQHTGLPFLAESQVGALYLLSLLFLSPLSPSLELSLFILIHFSLAAGFTFILARSLSMGYAAATIAGLGFGFGGFLMAQVPNLNIMTGAVWLPLILYGLLQTIRRRSWLAAVLTGLPLALQIFTAQPQIVFYTLVTIIGYGIYRVTADFIGDRSALIRPKLLYGLHTGLLLGLTIIAGLAFAAPQLLPTMELQQLSVRAQERDFDFLTKNSLPLVMLLNMLLPSIFGNNVTGFEGGDPFQEDFIYIGLIPFILISFSLGQRHRRDLLFFILLVVVGILLAMGRYTPLYRYIIQYLPGFSLFRIPARWLIVVNLALAILAGFGLETLLQQGLSRKKLMTILITGSVVVLCLGLCWGFGEDLNRWSREHWSGFHHKLLTAFLEKGYSANPIYQNRLFLSWVIGLTIPVGLLISNIVVTLIFCTLYSAQKIGPARFSALLVLALSVDLVAAGGTTINPVQPESWWHQLSPGGEFVQKNIGQARVFPLGMGSEQATVTHLGQYFPSVYHIRSAGGHGSSLMLERLRTFLDKAHPVQAIQLLGVRYLLTEGQMGADAAATYPIAFSDETAFVYENKSPLPRAFMVHTAIFVDTLEEAMANFKGISLDPRQSVVIEAEDGLASPTSFVEEMSQATIVRENPQMIEIQVNATADGYLVLLDTFYPGWVATIDGHPTPIYPANVIGRVIFVPVGEHIVYYHYRPLSFKLGIWISGLMLALLGIIAIVNFRQSSPI